MGIVLLVMTILILAIGIVLIIFLVKYNKLNKRFSKFMRGKDAASMEKEIIALYEDNQEFKKEIEKEKKDIRILYDKVAGAVQKVGLIKYDAYQQMGGLLSFSLALLDEENNGVLMNSVHTTDGCYTYTKEIVAGECRLELGNEEKMALDQAIGE
jgi:hypothetical protein